MFRRFRNNPEIKYVGGMMIATAIVQILMTTADLKEILFVAQFIIVEIFLTVSFQALSRDMQRRSLELKRVCGLTHAANMRLIKDVVILKGLLRKRQEKMPESCFEKSNRIVTEALKHKTPAKRNGKMISQRNKKNRVQPYTVRPVQPDMQDNQYVDMDVGAARMQPNKNNVRHSKPSVQEMKYVDITSDEAKPVKHVMPVRNNTVQKVETASDCEQSENANLLQAPGSSRQGLDNPKDQVLQSCMREQQYFCTRKKVRGRTVYERLCLICSAVMRSQGYPVYSKICQKCKPVHGQKLTHYKRLTKFNELIEFYCGCEDCFTADEPPCVTEYCNLCTIPRFTKKVCQELQPVMENES